MANIRIPEDVVDKNNELLHWAKYIVRLCTDACSIVVDNENSIDSLAKQIEGTPAGRMKGGSNIRGVTNYVGVWSHHTTGFEANSRAWDRPPPYAQCQDIIKRRIAAVCASRPASTGDTMGEGDILFQADGFKPGLKDAINGSYRGFKCKTKGLIHLNFTSEGLSERKKRNAGAFGSRKSVQYLYVFSKLKLKQDTKDRIHFSGRNLDDCLGPIHLPSYDSAQTFKVKHKDKPALYGECRVRCGGRVEETDSSCDEEAAKAPAAADLVPMTYAGMPWKVYDELIHDCNVLAWIETTMMDTTLAEVCVHRKLPFTGVVPTKVLADELMVRLVERVWEAAVDESHRDHKFALVKLLKDLRSSAGSSKTQPKPKAQAAGKHAEEPAKTGESGKREVDCGDVAPPGPKKPKVSQTKDDTSALLAQLKKFESDG